MDEVICYRCGRKMRLIPRLGIYFCDNDGYIMSLKDASANQLVESESTENPVQH